MKMLKVFVLLCLARGSFGVIYSLNDTEYYRMPALYAQDHYDSCVVDPEHLYCLADLVLYSDQPSPLLNMIQAYTADTVKHFNHTQIHRAVCVNTTCSSYLSNSTSLEHALEQCISDMVYRDYQLRARLLTLNYCVQRDKKLEYDAGDMAVAGVYVLLILLNFAGTFYDYYFCEKDTKSGNKYLLAFSLRRNWKKLVAPSGEGPDPRLNRLKAFNGLRAMTMICVFFSHTTLTITFGYLDNPLYVERSYNEPMKQILFNGSLVTYTFFVMSSFLLGYNFMIATEKTPPSWTVLPKGVLMRWLRLTPVYALVLGTVSTLGRHLGHGPFWPLLVESEAEACRRYWWAHLLYINNYIYDDAACAPQTWYLAADSQLFVAGLALCALLGRGGGARRRRVLVALFVLSLVVPAAHTYLQDLDAVVLQSPETYRSLYAHDDTFRLVYARGHCNLSTYTLGLAGGFLVYHLQRDPNTTQRLKRYRWVTWASVPLALGVILSGGVFYADGARAPLLARVLYAALYKPLFQALVVWTIISFIFQLESVCRGVVEWRGWTWAGRASYAAFLLHTLVQRGLMGAQRAAQHVTDVQVMHFLASTTLLTFILAAIMWMMVESPISQVTKALLTPPRRHLESNMANTNPATNATAADGQTKL